MYRGNIVKKIHHAEIVKNFYNTVSKREIVTTYRLAEFLRTVYKEYREVNTDLLEIEIYKIINEGN